MLDHRTCDVGSGIWPDGLGNSWVTKTDLIQYSRCAHKVFLSYTDRKPYQDFITEAAKEKILRPGNRQEQEFVEVPPPGLTFVETYSVEKATQRGGYVRCDQLVRNHDFGYRGRLDLIAAKDGDLFPVEIKNHRKVKSEVDPVFQTTG